MLIQKAIAEADICQVSYLWVKTVVIAENSKKMLIHTGITQLYILTF